jgi:hypothetical protein
MDPATPTPAWLASQADPLVDLPYDQFTIWSFAPDSINVWNRAGDIGTGIQWLIIFGLTIAAIIITTKLITRLVNRDR